MIFTWLNRHLPSWLTPFVCGAIYAFMIVLVWGRWSEPSGVFRYAGF